jgi:hypothetical protein
LRTFTHRQGVRIRDLFDPINRGCVGILGRGLLYYLLVMPRLLGGFVLGSYIVYGDMRPHVDVASLGSRHLPLWAIIYSVRRWWPWWSATEELTYQTFFLNRLQQALGGPLGAMAIVGFWWGSAA